MSYGEQVRWLEENGSQSDTAESPDTGSDMDIEEEILFILATLTMQITLRRCPTSGAFCGDDDIHNIDFDDAVGAGFVENKAEKIDSAVSDMLARAQTNGVPPAGLVELHSIVGRNRSILCLKMPSALPVDVLPFGVLLMPNAPQVRYSPRHNGHVAGNIFEFDDPQLDSGRGFVTLASGEMGRSGKTRMEAPIPGRI